ncbi:outer membrane beta-barrel protein [Aquisalinus flavus]|uniref:Outer membrane protein beta-barrel domain-containing protein n=1 Tax=Aquisalinus flavus TaxID=1526572 RepID=A0A8J2Y5W3_9PROT|nr:outer membrane beta-barrel protein [Aquisalinus flavus]MBD0427619.1 outer membrane beta-barrel protein [Aquisalinus flavus]UNE47406.1 porin family protein [Aquisalinus flavus]GGD02443.1 hypothetical protein GCM10011342_09330 [Aquisalinus flavus]
MSTKFLSLLAVLALPGTAVAQSSEPENKWEYIATAYGWFPGVSTTVETPIGDVEADVDFDEILETLDIAVLGAFEARKGRVALIGDLQFFDVSADTERAPGAFTGAEIDSQLMIFSAYATYALVDSDDLRFDVGGGLRYNGSSVEAQLIQEGGADGPFFEDDGGWTDLLLAARVYRQFSDKWYGTGYADVGGFGIEDSSELTWQLSAGLGYQFNDKWSTVGGYRHYSVEHGDDLVTATIEVSGPFLGVQARF